MANCLPFNAVQHDRVYKAEDWAWYFATFIGNGVFPKPSDGLQVVAHNGMEIRVNVGRAFINGYAFKNPAIHSIVLAMAERTMHRIDRVVVRWDLRQRDIYITILKGTPSAKPTPTGITRNTEIWELALADIYIGKGVTRIQTANITDRRFDSTVCGIVTGTVEEIDASVLTRQFDDFFLTFRTRTENEWNEWFEGIVDILESTENGKILAEVKKLYEELFRRATENDIDNIINGKYTEEDESVGIFETGTEEDIDNIINGNYADESDDGDITEEGIKNIVDQAFDGKGEGI